VVYTKSHGFNIEPFTRFFENDWRDYVTGKKDLKQHIVDNPDFWKWNGSPDSLLDYWFKTEDVRNEELLPLIQQLRKSGIKCYVATEQEKYRTDYMKKHMFEGLFDDVFSTCDIGCKKNDPLFFKTIIAKLGQEINDVQASNILFFDDSKSKVDTALSVGIDARLYIGAHQVSELLPK
jgi:putative hydrolase of the HAD superfamily